MRVLLFLSPVIFLIIGCSTPEVCEEEGWKVSEVTAGELAVKPGMVLTFHTDSLLFSDGSDSLAFGYLASDDRVILESRAGKRLFSLIKSDDSLMVWRELYTGHPLVIRMKKKPNR